MNKQEFSKLTKEERYALYEPFLEKKWMSYMKSHPKKPLYFEDFCTKYRSELGTAFIREILKEEV